MGLRHLRRRFRPLDRSPRRIRHTEFLRPGPGNRAYYSGPASLENYYDRRTCAACEFDVTTRFPALVPRRPSRRRRRRYHGSRPAYRRRCQVGRTGYYCRQPSCAAHRNQAKRSDISGGFASRCHDGQCLSSVFGCAPGFLQYLARKISRHRRVPRSGRPGGRSTGKGKSTKVETKLALRRQAAHRCPIRTLFDNEMFEDQTFKNEAGPNSAEPATGTGPAFADLFRTAADPDLTEDLALALLKRPDLPPDVLEKLAKNINAVRSRKVRIALASHAKSPRHVSVPLVRQFY